MGSVKIRQKDLENGMRRHACVVQAGDPWLARRRFHAGKVPCRWMLMICTPHSKRQDGDTRPAGQDHREDGAAHACLDFCGDIVGFAPGECRQLIQAESCRIRSCQAFDCLSDHGIRSGYRTLVVITEGGDLIGTLGRIEVDWAGNVQPGQLIRARDLLWAI